MKRPSPPRPRRLFVDAEAEIVDPETGRVVGMLYRWNTGEARKQWLGAPLKVFKLRPLKREPDPKSDA